MSYKLISKNMSYREIYVIRRQKNAFQRYFCEFFFKKK